MKDTLKRIRKQRQQAHRRLLGLKSKVYEAFLAMEKAATEVKAPMFYPPPLADDWSQWIVGEWEGAGESDTGQGHGIERKWRAVSDQQPKGLCMI